MDFNALIAELRTSSENLPKDSVDRSLLSSVYCNKACKVLDQIADNTDYDNVITGLWLVAAHFAEQLVYLKPVPALSELCFKLFRQCAKAVLNIQWQNLEEESSLRQNFLASLANLHAKLVPLDFPRFRLLETLTENPWTNPTLAKVMGGEVEETDKEEVRSYIEQEDPIILQLRVDMMLKENCEEYALNLCNSCLSHPELQSDLGVRKTQLSLLYKLGQEDKLQEECQKLSIQDAVRIIKQLQTSETHRQICTVLAQTFMVQNWIRPSDMEANKELLRLWIRHQLLVDREQDQFKESVWAMAKLSQSTEQIVIFIDVLREECGESYLQLYVDMCIFAINVDKGQMESNKKEGNMEAAGARRSDMASICAKLSCLCHHASLKVARICALTSFALKPTEQSFAKIGTFYGQGTDCCNKCGVDRNREPGTVNPASLYEVERLLNMLRPDYLSPDQSYANIQILCRRFLQESLKNAQQIQRDQLLSQKSGASNITQVNTSTTATSVRPTNVFEALSPQDYQNTQTLLNRLRLQTVSTTKATMPASLTSQNLYHSNRPNILQHGQQSASQQAGQTNKPKYVFDVENIKSKQPYGVPVEQQHQYYLIKHQKELEQRRKNAQKKRDEKTQQNVDVNSQIQLQSAQLLQQQQFPKQQQNIEVTQIIQTALKRDSNTLQKLTQGASPVVVQAVLNMMKETMMKTSQHTILQQQHSISQQAKPMVSSPQPLPTVSTLLKPSTPVQQLQKQAQPQQPREQSPPRRYPRPQLYAQPIIVSTSSSVNSLCYQPPSSSSRNHTSTNLTTMSLSSIGDKQKAENYLIAKSHVDDIRRFMQMQMSNLHQKQISENRQMSGSTIVTMSNAANKTDPTSYNFTNRPKTTVELAEQAALAKLHKQDISKPSMYQQAQHIKGNIGQTFTSDSTMSKSQQMFTTSNSRPESSLQHQQQKLLHVQQQQPNNAFNYQNNQNSSSVLPSSDELSGSIMGVDDTIIKELLQDSGLLANTFPDIEVDTIGEDKSRKFPEHFLLPQTSTPPTSSHISRLSKPQLYTFSSHPVPTALPPQRLPASRNNSITVIRQMQNLSGSSSQPPASGMNRYSMSPAATGSLTTMSQPNMNKPLNPNTFSGYSNQVLSNQQLRTNTKFPVTVPPRENISVLPKKETKQEVKPTVDQLREMMKMEDIQGEIYMDAANNATYRCIICSFAFETLDHLREHVRKVCKPGLQSSSVYNTKIKQDRANSAKAGVETTTVFQCLRCFELCVSDAGIKQHRLTCKRVPTVPSDLKKETAAPKPKIPQKISTIKQGQKKEVQDNSLKIPELPLPFPYPSLNAAAVLKSMSMTGSHYSQLLTETSCADTILQNPSVANEMVNKSTTPVPVPLPSTTTRTSGIEPIQISPSSSAISSHTNSPQIQTGSIVVNSTKTPIISSNITSTVSTKDLNIPPQIKSPSAEPVGATTKLEDNPLLKDDDKPIVKVTPDPPPQPRFTEITGSGGSKFFKCGICSQTLCSFESFLVHWNECAMKNKHLVRRLEMQDKPITAEVIEKLLAVLADVAAGSGTIPETIIVDPEWNDLDEMFALRDPCKEGSPDSVDSYEDYESASWYESESSENQGSLSDSVEDKQKGGDRIDESKFRGRKSGQEDNDEDGVYEENEKTLKKVKKKYSDDYFDDDSSRTESEQSYMSAKEQSYISTREAPPKLRDRKTLKPIHSFINEAFNSSRTTTKSTKLDNISKDITDEEDQEKHFSSESEAESDGESLYCKICQTSYQTKRILLQHFAGKHLQPYTVKTVADSSSYFCHLCQKTFSTFMHYMQHVPNHSITIYEKMKTFVNNKKSSQRSERIASQRGLSKKGNTVPKIAKDIIKKAGNKSDIDRLQFLAGKTQLVRERLRISKRKRSLHSTVTSSDDDYSSDASNNVVFKSKKSAESEIGSNEQKPVSRSRNSRPTRQSSQLQDNEDDSSMDQSGEDSDNGPKLGQDRDDDYVLSEDYESDGVDTNTPPATRSRKRITLSLRSSDSKKRRASYDLELSESEVSENKNIPGNGKRYLYHFQDFDEDSNTSVLVLSQEQNGKFMPCVYKEETPSSSDGTSNTKGTEQDKELNSACVIFVRSLGRRQKEWLSSCDLQPTVVLKPLSVDDSDRNNRWEIHSSMTTPDQQIGSSLNKNCVDSQVIHTSSNEVSEPESATTKTSSFLDSFLTYLNQYPSSEEKDKPGRKRNTSEPPRERGSHRRRGSLDGCQAIDKNQNSVIVGHTTSTELKVPERIDSSEVKTPNSNVDFISKFRTRRCSVNLGQRLSLEDLQANTDLLSLGRVTPMQDKTNPSATASTDTRERPQSLDNTHKSFASTGDIAGRNQTFFVSLERIEKADKLTTAVIPILNEINYKSQSGTKEVDEKNKSLTESIEVNIMSYNRLSEVNTDCGSSMSLLDSEVLPCSINTDMDSKQGNSSLSTKSTHANCPSIKTTEDSIQERGISECFQPKPGERRHTEAPGSHLVEESRLFNFSSLSDRNVLASSKQADSEISGNSNKLHEKISTDLNKSDDFTGRMINNTNESVGDCVLEAKETIECDSEVLGPLSLIDQKDTLIANPQTSSSIPVECSDSGPRVINNCPNSKIVDDNPSSKVAGDCPKSSVNEDCPSSSVIKDSPNSKVIEDHPHSSVIKDSPKVIDDCPDSSVTEDCSNFKAIDVCSHSKVTEDCPISKVTEDFPVLESRVPDDCPDTKFGVTDDCHNQSSKVIDDCENSKLTNVYENSEMTDDGEYFRVTGDCEYSKVADDCQNSKSGVIEDCHKSRVTKDCIQSLSRETNDCSEIRSRITDDPKLSTAAHNREVKGTSDIVMSCTIKTILDTAENYDDPVSFEQSPVKHNPLEGVTLLTEQHNPAETNLKNCSSGVSQCQIEAVVVIETEETHKPIGAGESEKPKTQGITKTVDLGLEEKMSCDVFDDKSKPQNTLQSVTILAASDVSEKVEVCDRVSLGLSCSVITKNDNMGILSILVKEDQVSGELCCLKDTIEKISSDETVMEVEKCVKAQNSIAENDSSVVIKAEFGSGDEMCRLTMPPSTSKDKTDRKDNLLTYQKSKAYKEISVIDCTIVEEFKIDTNKKSSISTDQQSKITKEKFVADCPNVEVHKEAEISKQKITDFQENDTSYQESMSSSKQNKPLRKQGTKVKAILNPSISLAAFIAERLTKPKQGSSFSNRPSYTKSACVGQAHESSPLYVGYQSKEPVNPVLNRSLNISKSQEGDHHVIVQGKSVNSGHDKSTYERSTLACHDQEKSAIERSALTDHEKSALTDHEKSALTGQEKSATERSALTGHEESALTGPCSGLVDYSSSDGEDDSCRLNENETSAKEATRNIRSENFATAPFVSADIDFHSLFYPPKDGKELSNILGQSKDQIGTEIQNTVVLLSAEANKFGAHHLESSLSKEESGGYYNVQVESGNGQETIMENSVPVLQNQTQKNGTLDKDIFVKGTDNKLNETVGESSEKAQKECKPLEICRNVAGTISKNESVNANLDGPFLLDTGSCHKKSLNESIANSGGVLVTIGGERERTQQSINDSRIMSDVDKEKQSVQQNVGDNVQKLSYIANYPPVQLKSISLEECNLNTEELVPNCDLEAVIVTEVNTNYSKHERSTLTDHEKSASARMTERTSCEGMAALPCSEEIVQAYDDDDVGGFWRVPSELLEANESLKSGMFPVIANVRLNNSYGGQPADRVDSSSHSQTNGKMCEGTPQSSVTHENLEENVKAVLLSHTDHSQGHTQEKESNMATCLHVDIYEEEVHLISPLYIQKIAKDEDSPTERLLSGNQAFVSNSGIAGCNSGNTGCSSGITGCSSGIIGCNSGIAGCKDTDTGLGSSNIDTRISHLLLCVEKSQDIKPHCMSGPPIEHSQSTKNEPEVQGLSGEPTNIFMPGHKTSNDLSLGKDADNVPTNVATSLIVGVELGNTVDDFTSTPSISTTFPSDLESDISLRCPNSVDYVRDNDELDKSSIKSSHQHQHSFVDLQTEDEQNKELLKEVSLLRHSVSPKGSQTGQSLIHNARNKSDNSFNCESRGSTEEKSSTSAKDPESTKLSVDTVSQPRGLEVCPILDSLRTNSESRTADPPSSRTNNESRTADPTSSRTNSESRTADPPSSRTNSESRTADPPSSRTNNESRTADPTSSRTNSESRTADPPSSRTNSESRTADPPSSRTNSESRTADPPSSRTDSESRTADPPSSRTNSESRTADPPVSPCERQTTDCETDEGDDLSDFDLVIENDTSYRSLSFPITLEKKSYVPSLSSSSYSTKEKINYSSSTTSTVMSCVAYNRLLTSEDDESSLGHKPNTVLRKTLVSSKNLNNGNQERFVWDIDDDNDSYKNVPVSSQTVSSTNSLALRKASAIETVSNPALEALKRKQKALREKSETAPFTWDLEEFSDNPTSSPRNTPSKQSSTKASSDILSFSSQGRNKNLVTCKALKKITQRKRPLTPDFQPGKMPAKLRRTSSVEGHAKSSSAPVCREDKRVKHAVSKCDDDNDERSGHCSSVDPMESPSNNSITVDEEISFKKDSFSSPDGLILTGSQIFQLANQEKKLRKEKSQKQSKLLPQTTVGHHDDRSNSSSHADEEESKHQSGLRSRHSSMESNQSDKSVSTKRAAEGLHQANNKRPKRNEIPETPKLKKIGLIKVNKDSLSPPASETDSPVPLTRSSEAAIRAFNQKSLRSRGVSLAQASHSPQLPVSKNISPNVHSKSIAEVSSRLKGAVTVQKVSPLSLNTVRNSITEPKPHQSSNSSRRSQSSVSDTAAVVKRRSLPSHQPPGVVHVKSPLAIKSRKSLAGHSNTPTRTTIFRVDPLPDTAMVSKGAGLSHVATSAKGTRTLHTRLPPDTMTAWPEKDANKQPKWKIRNETKSCKGKKQHK